MDEVCLHRKTLSAPYISVYENQYLLRVARVSAAVGRVSVNALVRLALIEERFSARSLTVVDRDCKHEREYRKLYGPFITSVVKSVEC